MIEHVTQVSCCPKCGHRIDRASNLTGSNGPQEGDYTLCIKCGGILTWDKEMKLRAMTEEEVSGIPSDTLGLITKAQEAIREMRRVN